jgi:hypothetical protein
VPNRFLRRVYPKVHIALHAGELVQGDVPPEELSFHIRSSVKIGNAERIGHGVSIMYENQSCELLRELARDKSCLQRFHLLLEKAQVQTSLP